MKHSIFNPDQQNEDLSSKIVAGMERISEVFKVLIWEKAKLIGLSPIQIQLLLFVAFHKKHLCHVSHLAKEFNITKATVSDAIKMLDKKGFISKDFSASDSRSYIIVLSESGKDLVSQMYDFADPLRSVVSGLNDEDQIHLFDTLSELIYKLNRKGILSVQRTCYGCKFYDKKKNDHYCNLLQMRLTTKSIRLDCPEFEEQAI